MQTASYRRFQGVEMKQLLALSDSYLGAAMVRTPWGDAAKLRAQKLRPGASTPREEVVRNQRERLFGAMVAVVSEKGYEATTVADLVELSGVSRSDFYEHFDNKEKCLLAALETIIETVKAGVSSTYDGQGTALRTMIELIVAQPATARFCLVDAYAAGPAAEEMLDRAAQPFEALFEQRLASQQRVAEAPTEMVRAIVGGLRKVVHTRLYRGEEELLVTLAEGLREWSFGYLPPPVPLQAPRRRRFEPLPFDGYTSSERILRAVAAVSAENGYRAMSTDDIAERASISLSTFYAHFADKRDAVLAALEMSGAKMMAAVVPAARRAADWREGVRVVYEAMLAFMAAEPAFAHLATVEVYAIGAPALSERDRVLEMLGAMLAPGYAENPGVPEIAAEAIVGAVYTLLGNQIRNGGAETLPEAAPLATYLTLCPFVGAEQACAVANGDWRRR